VIVPENKKSFSITSILKTHDRQSFDCGSTPLNLYLQRFALQTKNKNSSRTFILVDKQNPHLIIGFYTLVIAEVQCAHLPDTYAKKYKPVMPGINLARLAVDERFKGRGYGELLLMDALNNIKITAEKVGIAACFVDAKEGVGHFYIKYGFISFPVDPDRYLLPIKTIMKLLE